MMRDDMEAGMSARHSNKGSRNANALAVVAGALIALIAVLAFLAVISHRGGAQERRVSTAAIGAAALPGSQLTVSVCAVAS